LGIDGPITLEILAERRVTRGLEYPVKILGRGELTKALTVQAHAVSEAAKAAIERVGGSVELLERNDDWVQARPRTRRLPLNRELKRMRVGKVGGPTRREALTMLAANQES
jgi:hypothetical protein